MAMAEVAATAFAPVLRENFDFGCNVRRIDEFLLRRYFRAVGVSLWILLPPTSVEANEIGRTRLAQTEPQAKPPANDPTTVAPTPPARAVKNSAPARSKSPAKAAQPTPVPEMAAPSPSSPVPTLVPTQQQELNPADRPQPVFHAKNAGFGPCLTAVERGAAVSIDAPHVAFSSWNPGGPNLHVFQSIVALVYANQMAPRSAAIILATQAASGCDSTAVQVYPSARSCPEIEKDMLKTSRPLGSLAGLSLLEKAESRHLLMPTAGNGCVIVATTVHYVPAAGAQTPAPGSTPPVATQLDPTKK
jgi:hypothetical protein